MNKDRVSLTLCFLFGLLAGISAAIAFVYLLN